MSGKPGTWVTTKSTEFEIPRSGSFAVIERTPTVTMSEAGMVAESTVGEINVVALALPFS